MGTLISRHLLAVLVFALTLGCRPEVVQSDRTVFLSNLPIHQVSAGEARPYALHAAEMRVALRSAAVGFDTRRALVQSPGVDVTFHELPMEGAVLETAVLYRGPLGAEATFSMEIEAIGSDGQRIVIWQATLAAPLEESDRQWQEIVIPLPAELTRSGPNGNLSFRSSCEAESPISFRQLPGWSNPRLVYRKVEERRAKSQHRNIIVFLVDTLRQDHLGTYGYDRPTSPHLDALAEESLVFTAAHSAAPWTKASVASLFTSLPPSLHGAENYQDRLGNAEVTLAEALQQAGYRTGAVGTNSWVFNSKFNMLQGFEEAYSVIDCKREGGARADSVVAEAIDWLERNRDEPFFLYIHTIDPHEPYAPSAELRNDFQRTEYSGTLTGRLEGLGAHNKKTREQISEADIDFLHDLYDAEIRFADERLGELIRYLKQNALFEETTLIVTADHGEKFLEHGGWSHGGSVHQEEIAVPLVIKPPASMKVPPARISEPVGLTDVAPTICSLARIAYRDLPFFGQNLLPLAMAPKLWDKRVVLSELNKDGLHIISLRRGARKYMRYFQPYEREYLFDLDLDPGEQHDLSKNAPPGELQGFQTILKAHLEQAPRAGLVIEILSNGRDAHATLTVAVSAGQLDYGLVDCERDGDRFYQRPHGNDLLVELEVGGKDTRDGVRLHLEPKVSAVVTFLAREAAIDPSRILLGPSQAPANSTKISLSDDDESLWVSERPAWDDREGVWGRIWNLRPQEVVLDEDEIAELQALGYLGD